MTGAHLELTAGDGVGARHALAEGVRLVVGRSPAASVTLSDRHLSGTHFDVSMRGGRAWLTDLGSTNGTRLNGVRTEHAELADGDRITAGSHDFVVRLPAPEVAPPPAAPHPPVPPPAPPTPPPTPGPPGAAPAPLPGIGTRSTEGRRRGLLLVGLLAAGGSLLVVALALVAVALVGDSGRWDLLPSMVRSVLGNGWSGRLRPAPGASTGTAALDLRPTPAVRLTAPAGALDTTREFDVTLLDKNQLAAFSTTAPSGVLVPLAGIRLESGMGPRDLLPGALTVTLDLDGLGVPEGLRDLADVYHVDADGALRRQLVRRRGDRVELELRHNGPILVGALAVALGTLYGKEEAQKWGGVGEWLGGSYWFHDVGTYRVWYPSSLGWRRTPELERVEAELERLWQAARPRPATTASAEAPTPPGGATLPSDRHERAAWAAAYLADARVQKLLGETWRKPEWVRANVLPWQVVHVVTALERAHGYLFTHRKLRPPSGGSVDVILLRDFSAATGGGTEFGFASDGYFSYPYIQLNRDRIPDDPTPSPVHLDNLDTTVLHELFHVAQKEYFNWSKYLRPSHAYSGARYTWFMEATALVLEEEAAPYYASKKWTRTHFETTYDQSEHLGYFKLPLDAAGPDETTTQRKGYAASRFLLELKRRYYAGNPEAFLPAYLGAFCSFSNPAEALVGVTSSSDEVLGADYLLFSSRHARDIAAARPLPPSEPLDAAHPVRSWPLDPKPLSTPFWRLDLSGTPAATLKDGLLVLRTHRLAQHGVVTRFAAGGGDPVTARSPTGTESIPARTAAAGEPKLLVQRVETYVDTPWSMGSIASFFGGEPKTTALLMLPPTNPPKLELLPDTNTLKVTVEPSKLWKAGELKEVHVRIGPPDRKAYTFAIGGDLKAEIPWEVAFHDVPEIEDITDARVRGLLAQQDLVDMHAVWRYFTTVIEPGELKLNVRYREVAKTNPDDPPDDPGVDGPWSRVFEVPVDRSTLAKLDYDVSGTWSGTSMILHDPVSVTLEQRGADIVGTCTHGGVVYLLEGHWKPEEKGWEVLLLTTTKDGMAGSLVSPYLRRMAGEELWLAWPTCVLRRDPPRQAADEDQRGWLDRLLGR